MREIKYRAWDVDLKRMIYPDIIHFGLTNHIRCGFIIQDIDVWEDCEHFILTQYTGLKDKNRREGYHNDIWTDGLHKYLVDWIDKKACFVLKGITIAREYSMAHFPEGEIIGNTYENP